MARTTWAPCSVNRASMRRRGPAEATPSPTSTGCDCPTGDPRIESWKCGTDCFACPGRTSLASDQVCRANGCQNFYSLTQAECENFKTLNLGQTCPGGGFKGLSHFGAHSRRSRGAATSASILKTTRGPAEGAGRPERRPRIRRRTSLRSLLFPSPWRKFSPFPVEASGGFQGSGLGNPVG